MKFNLLEQLKQLNIKHRRKSKWRGLLVTLSAVVVFCTTYMLILPAITVADRTVCGYLEHIHTDSCYTGKKVLSCSEEQTEGHLHNDNCYAEKEIVVCGEAESDAHTHTDECKSVKRILTCTKQEQEAHSHSDACYKINKTLVCDEREHTHSAKCYGGNVYKNTSTPDSISAFASTRAANKTDTIPSDSEHDRYYSDVYMYYEFSRYNLDYTDASGNKSNTGTTTFALVPVKADETYKWTPNPDSDWTSDCESNYDVAYCADINVYTSGSGDVYYDSIPISNTTHFTDEQKTRLTAIVQHAYPFISYDQAIRDIKEAGYTLTSGCSRGELITGTQWAIWEIANKATVSGCNSGAASVTTSNTIHPLTGSRAYSSSVKNDVKAIHDYLASRTAYTKVNLSIASEEVVDIKSNGDGTCSVTVKVTLNRELTDDESAYVTITDSNSNTLTVTAPYNTTSFEVTLDNVSEDIEHISVEINGSSSVSYLSPIFYDSDNYQDMVSAKLLTPTYYDSVMLKFSGEKTVAVTKKWKGNTGADSVEVTLYADGEQYSEPVILNADNNWSYEWKNLPIGSLTDMIDYTVKETPVAGYYTDITSDSDEKEVTLHNWVQASTLEDGKTYMLLSSNGALASQNNSSGNIQWLSTDTSSVTTEQQPAMWTAVKTTNGFNLHNKQSGNNLALIYSYSSRSYRFYEKTSSAYYYSEALNFSNNKLSALYSNNTYYLTSIRGGYGSSSTSSGNGTSFTLYEFNEETHKEYEQSFTITNTKIDELTSVEVTKVWNDSNGNPLAETPESVNVRLYANGEQYGQPVKLNNENLWTYVWSDLPKVDTNDTPIEYKVKEDVVEGFESSIEESSSSTTTNLTKWQSATALEDGKTYIFVSNGQALSKTNADNELLEFKAVDVTDAESTHGLSMWTATKSGNGFKLVNTAKTDRTLAFYSNRSWSGYTRRFVAANDSSANINTRELNYSNGYITASNYRFGNISGGYGSESTSGGILFELYELAQVSVTDTKTEFVITNTKAAQTVDLKIKKVDFKDNDKALPNVAFDLYHYTGVETDALIPYTTDKYGVKVSENITTDADGFISVEDLTENVVYYLVETQAADGYNLLNVPIEFKITDGRISLADTQMANDISAGDEIVLLVKNEVGYTLPATGGRNNYLVTLGGLLLISTSILLLYKKLFGKRGVSF